MTKLLLDNLDRNNYEIVVVFANTGKEREETFDFIRKCDEEFGFNTQWAEAVINPERGAGTRAKLSITILPIAWEKSLKDMIRKYEIPNIAFKHCTRELKIKPIHSYVKYHLGWKDYYTAIGIRNDETNRVNSDWGKGKIIYPLIITSPSTRYDVNKYWINQTFDLQLKSFEGNCDICYKKSERKICTIAWRRRNT